jgi:hypothetical protein
MRANIYIRKENEEAWKAIADKSAQVNHWIGVDMGYSVINPEKITRPIKPANTSVGSAGLTPASLKNRTIGLQSQTCKNGHPLDKFGNRCMEKGCKYA